MHKVRELLERLISEESLIAATVSGPKAKGTGQADKVKVKPVRMKTGLHYQFAFSVGPKVLHENVPQAEAAAKLAGLLETSFKQGVVQATEADYQIFVNKPEKASILKKSATKKAVSVSHNRTKNYVLPEGEPVPFLVELGVMNEQGKVLAAKSDKFRQINRFLEMVADVASALPRDRRLTIVDFGCGKSYLTFAIYHYLVINQGLDVQIVGLDLKADVIANCSALAEKLDYDGLRFLVGDIGHYEGTGPVDMVVTLHACDTATDAALEKAVRWGAEVILSVPCCQHELFGQVQSEILSPMLGHGIIRERFSALATDSVRAHLLELLGYKTQILEFIDMEHTPKNLLIRAVKSKTADNGGDDARVRKLSDAYLEFKRFLNIDPYLERALADRLGPLLQRHGAEN